MSLIQLICYLGGLAGLWLGVSVMTVSGWLAQLYPFLQKWNIKQRFILLSAKRNLKYAWDGARNLADRRRNNGGYRQQAAKVGKSSKVAKASVCKLQTKGGGAGGCCLNGEVIVTTATTATIPNGGVLEMGMGTSASNYPRRHPLSSRRHCSPSQLVKQSSVNSTTTDIDSGLSMESKASSSSSASSSSYLDDMMSGERGDSLQEQNRDRDRDNDLDEEEEDDQTRMMIGEAVLKNGENANSNGNSGNGIGNGGGGFNLELRRSGKRRRHSMMAQMMGFHGSGGSSSLFDKPSTPPTTSSATPPQSTGSPLPLHPPTSGSPGHHLTQQASSNSSSNNFSIPNFSTSSSTPSETLKQHLRWKARRNAYWSNYSSMSTSSDDLSLISNTTSSTMTGGGGSVTGIATATSTAFRRMSLVNSKFSCKV